MYFLINLNYILLAFICLFQGHAEAYGSYSELLECGVELMQLMTTEDYTDDRNLFTLNKKDLFENEGESRLGGGVNGLLRGEKRNRGTLVSI